MNHYRFEIQGIPKDTADAPANAACTKLARVLGLAMLGSDFHAVGMGWNEANKRTRTFEFQTRFRFPSTIDAPSDWVGRVYNDAGNQLVAAGNRSMEDEQCTTVLNNQDKAVVDAGDFICAILPPGADVSNELSSMLAVPVLDVNQVPTVFGYVVFGIANTTARDGVYQTPFAAACGYANFGPPSTWQAVVLPANAMQTHGTALVNRPEPVRTVVELPSLDSMRR